MQRVNFPDLRHVDIERLLCWAVSTIAFLFPIAVLTVNRADSIGLLLLASIGVYAFLRYGVMNLRLGRPDFFLMLVFSGWYAVIVLCYFLGDRTDIGFKLLGRDLRLLFFVPALIACRRYLTNARNIFWGLVLAPFATLGLGFWQFTNTHDHIWRISGYADFIPFGDLSMAMAFMALSFLLATERRRMASRYFLSGAALSSGVVVSVLSGARGGWISVPILLLATVIVLSRRSGRRGLKVFALCGLFVLFASLLVPRTIIRSRADEAINNIQNYYDYYSLIERHDLERIGCLNDSAFLLDLESMLQTKYGGNLQFSVIDDHDELLGSGFIVQCQSGDVLKVMNSSKNKNGAFAIPRSLVRPLGEQTVKFIAQGKGMISIANANDRLWQQFDYDRYKLLQHKQVVNSLSWPVFLVPPGGVLRLAPIQNNIGEYVFPFANDSVGQRLEMWRAAWHIFKRHPYLGAGTGAFEAGVIERARAGDVSPAVMSYDHPHNDILNSLSSQGIIGGLFYLLAMGCPLIVFIRALRNEDGYRDKRAIGFAGILMVLGLFVFGLTETMFTHSIVMSWYVTFVAMFVAIVLRNDDKMRDVKI